MRRLDGIVQLVLAGVLVAGVVWGAKPAQSVEVAARDHNPATCAVCRNAPTRPVGEGDAVHGLVLGAERHLRLCAICRDAGLTPADVLDRTPCLNRYLWQETHSANVTR
jgi:hypothetical protein